MALSKKEIKTDFDFDFDFDFDLNLDADDFLDFGTKKETAKKSADFVGEGVGGSLRKRQKVAAKISDKVKQFLGEMNIREEVLKKPTLKILDNIDKFEFPKKDTQIRVRTQTQLNLISMILRIIQIHREIDELTIATYTFNKEAFGIIQDCLKSGKIKKFNLLIASSYSFREPKYFKTIKMTLAELSKSYAVTMTVAWIHFKITTIRCDDDFYQFEGSMNYSTNNMAEQILICNSRKVYEYDYDFMMKTCRDSSSKALEIIC